MQRLEKGIITGDTISVILFSSAMNVMVKSADKEYKELVMKSGIRQPTAKAFMDDLTIITTQTTQTRWLLAGLGKLIKRARMKFNAKKSRSVVLKRGKPSGRFKFKVAGEIIPDVKDQPKKCIGKFFDESLKDTTNVKNTKEQLERCLTRIHKSELPGKFKAWYY